jgi:hypothetical protein
LTKYVKYDSIVNGSSKPRQKGKAGMKIKTILLLSIIISSINSHVYAALTTNDPLIAALIHVESHGNDYAVGDRGKGEKAYGALQIRKPCVDDVNRRFGTKYQAKDMLGN